MSDWVSLIRYNDEANRVPNMRDDAIREWAHPNTGAPGVAIVDTPGTGSIFQKHEKTAKEFLHRSDLVIFVISAKHAFAETERMYLELAKNYGKGPVSMSEISKKQDIPVKYLQQIIIPLKKANLVSSIRGPKGGHILARPPDQVNLWELLLLLESKLTCVDCLREENACENAETS